jgi:hypothetical protein
MREIAGMVFIRRTHDIDPLPPVGSDCFCALDLPRLAPLDFALVSVLTLGEQIPGKPSRQKKAGRNGHQPCGCENDNPRNMVIPKTIKIHEVRSASQYIDRQRGTDQCLRKLIPGRILDRARCLASKPSGRKRPRFHHGNSENHHGTQEECAAYRRKA